MTSDKLQQLFKMLERQPRDAFLLYGIGMEYKKLGDDAKAIEYFGVIEVDPNYCYAYYQKAQAYERGGDDVAARTTYRAGIDAANRTGDAHAKDELEAALSDL